MKSIINNQNEYHKHLEEYQKIKTPESLLNFMTKHISYGIFGTDNKEYTTYQNDINSEFQIACQTKYALCDKERILRYGLGVCLDQVELERFWFKEHNYNFKTFFIWFNFEQDNNYPTHTYLVFEKNDKYYYFEHADSTNRGIYELNSYKEAILYQMNNHIKHVKKNNLPINDEILNHIQVIEFKINNYKISMNEYYDNIVKSKKVYENKKFK